MISEHRVVVFYFGNFVKSPKTEQNTHYDCMDLVVGNSELNSLKGKYETLTKALA